MRAIMAACVAVGLGLGIVACQQHQDKPEKPPAEVAQGKRNSALLRGVDYLLKKQQGGNWESGSAWPEAGRQHGGETALAVLALLKTGPITHDSRLAPDSAQVGPAVAWVIHNQTSTVYTTALKVLVLCQATPTPERNKLLGQNTGALIRALGKDGGYSYDLEPGTKASDSSNTDYGLMAVAEASRHGVQVPADYWSQVERFWRTRQNPDGGWGYAPPELRPQSNPAMSAGAVASLLELKYQGPAVQKNIDRGLGYAAHNLNARSSDYYYLYNLRRLLTASDLYQRAGQDADTIMAAELLRTQQDDGSWTTERVSFWGKPNRTISTAYAMLALR